MNTVRPINRFSVRSCWIGLGTGLLGFALTFLIRVAAISVIEHPVALWVVLPGIGAIVGLVLVMRRALIQLYHEGLGAAAFQEKRFDEAESHFRKSWSAAQNLAPRHPSRGRILGWLALVTEAQGKFDDAESFSRDRVTAEENCHGPMHPSTADALEALAGVYVKIARYRQAVPLFERALHIREVGPVAPQTFARCLRALAMVWACLEQFDQAEANLRRALDVARRAERVPKSEFALLACDLSRFLARDRTDEAEALAENALVSVESSANPDSMVRAECLVALACVRQEQGRLEEAEELIREAIATKRQCYPHNPVFMQGDLHELAGVLRHQSRWAESEECFREALVLAEEYFAPEDIRTARLLTDFAELLDVMGRGEEAGVHGNHAQQIRDFHSPFRIV